MALDQLKSFLLKMQNDALLKQSVLAASTADDVAKIGNSIGFEFSGDELLRFSGKKWDASPCRNRKPQANTTNQVSKSAPNLLLAKPNRSSG